MEAWNRKGVTTTTEEINILTTKPRDLSAMSESEWVELEVTVDSGACDTVVPLDAISHVSITPSPQSQAGLKYEAANGQEIDNVGEKKVLRYGTGVRESNAHASPSGKYP